MARPEKIKLGNMEFEVLPLSFGALEELEDSFAALAVALPGRERFNALRRIILAGIQTKLPDFTADALDRIPAVEKRQVSDATDAIARVSGMAPQPDGDAAPETAPEGKDPAASVQPGTI